jgi:hypothetical protein
MFSVEEGWIGHRVSRAFRTRVVCFIQLAILVGRSSNPSSGTRGGIDNLSDSRAQETGWRVERVPIMALFFEARRYRHRNARAA